MGRRRPGGWSRSCSTGWTRCTGRFSVDFGYPGCCLPSCVFCGVEVCRRFWFCFWKQGVPFPLMRKKVSERSDEKRGEKRGLGLLVCCIREGEVKGDGEKEGIGWSLCLCAFLPFRGYLFLLKQLLMFFYIICSRPDEYEKYIMLHTYLSCFFERGVRGWSWGWAFCADSRRCAQVSREPTSCMLNWEIHR